ncbi:MAG: sigma-54-dependent Fis family transcriptional regulator [Verrucomicrobia bacterium]|jgi:DNA-binding NtrC family response regulator|nr:MAG: sigma-54-dependent Fis family transcriptional regulator [Verrucomicrobiota bacterium]MDH4469457.1 sigma-54 dependent transcriptional regulator [Verrucomicrobiae bacterium]
MKKILLIVDDEKHTREGLKEAFSENYDVYSAATLDGALATLGADPADVLITDLKLGGENGMELMEKALALPKPPICIIMTAYGSVDTAVEAMRRGAYDFVTKPVNIERLEMLVRRSLREQAIEQENGELKQEIQKKYGLEQMIGTSPIMTTVFDTIRQVAPSKATILIEGESGTGKEVAAKAIHMLSPRSQERFVAVHCASLSPQLLESELFGHEKGAFTGATERRIGRFEQARGGTLFLDEIGEIDPSVQVKILRILGEHTFERVGGNQTLSTDVRLIAATNRDLKKMTTEGTFREDLFFRLNVVPLLMPPLRDRKEDIPLLTEAFLIELAKEHEKPQRLFSSEAMSLLIKYPWPGNVRELRTAVEHAIVLGREQELQIRDLPSRMCNTTLLEPAEHSITHSPDSLNLQQATSTMIDRALKECSGNRSQAAAKLGISRRTLHRHLASGRSSE